MSHSPLGLDMPRPRWSHWVSSVPDAFVGEGWALSPSHLPRPEDSLGASPHPPCRSQTPPSCSRGQIKTSAESCACYNGKRAAITSAELITHTRLKGRVSWVIKCYISLVIGGKSTGVTNNNKDHLWQASQLFMWQPEQYLEPESDWTQFKFSLSLFFLLWQDVVCECSDSCDCTRCLPECTFLKKTPASSLTTLLLLSNRPLHVSHTKTQPKPITSLMNICLIQPLSLSTAAVFSMPRHVCEKGHFRSKCSLHSFHTSCRHSVLYMML